MDTSLLKCFLTLADTQSFSEAAERLNITQSTVSHKIARLETLLGKQLFERTTRSCMLTSDGRELVEHATRVIRSIEEMEQSFKPDLLTGTLVVGVRTTTTSSSRSRRRSRTSCSKNRASASRSVVACRAT